MDALTNPYTPGAGTKPPLGSVRSLYRSTEPVGLFKQRPGNLLVDVERSGVHELIPNLATPVSTADDAG